MSITPYRLFDVALARKTALSPALCRITFAGADIGAMKTVSPDQRIKIFFPGADNQPSRLPKGPDWYQAYRALPPAARSPMRTYTIRHLRADAGELDVDFVLHGATGPASRWAIEAVPGDQVQIAAPNAAFAGDPGGYEWKPTIDLQHVLLIADETALPAVVGILEELARRDDPPTAQAILEVPAATDRIGLPAWDGLTVEWLPRDAFGTAPREGSLMAAAAMRAKLPIQAGTTEDVLPAIDLDRDILWERALPERGGFYAWIAGESEAVLAIRRFLVKERGRWGVR